MESLMTHTRKHFLASQNLVKTHADSYTAEANHPRNTHKPADIVLCDTETGVISIEVKAYDITRIERVVAGSKLFVKLGGEIKETAPWEQARSCMFDIRNEFERRFSASKIPWFSYMTAFPNIA